MPFAEPVSAITPDTRFRTIVPDAPEKMPIAGELPSATTPVTVLSRMCAKPKAAMATASSVSVLSPVSMSGLPRMVRLSASE